jgi:hypothetical protein
MIDDDETASVTWLSTLLKTQAEWGVDAVGGPVIARFEVPVPVSLARVPAFHNQSAPSGPIPRIYGTGNVLLCCRALYEASWPPFRDDFGLTGGGDSEYFARMSKRWLYAWAADAEIYETVPAERSTLRWALKRGFRIGNAEIRIALLHGTRIGAALSVAKSLATLAYAPALLFPSSRSLVLYKWWRAAGKLSALTGNIYSEYAGRH